MRSPASSARPVRGVTPMPTTTAAPVYSRPSSRRTTTPCSLAVPPASTPWTTSTPWAAKSSVTSFARERGNMLSCTSWEAITIVTDTSFWASAEAISAPM